MKSYKQFMKDHLLPLSTAVIVMIAIFIIYTIVAIPEKYASTAVLKSSGDTSAIVRRGKSTALTKRVDDKYGYTDQTTKNEIQVTDQNSDITITALDEDAIKAKKITDGVVSALSHAYPRQLSMVTAARVEDRPSYPSLLKNGIWGAICGLAAGVIGLSAYYYMKLRPKNE